MVYVLSKNGQPMMPTENHAKVRLLLKSGKAKVVRRCPFTIQLTGTSKIYTQECGCWLQVYRAVGDNDQESSVRGGCEASHGHR